MPIEQMPTADLVAFRDYRAGQIRAARASGDVGAEGAMMAFADLINAELRRRAEVAQ